METNPENPSLAREVNEVLRPFASPEFVRPILLFLFDMALVVTFAGLSIHAENVVTKLAWSLVAGLAIGLLFVVGHDACHGSFTPWRGLNRLIGTVAFLPSLHSFSLWDHGHNRLHHRFTNLKKRDYVFRPLSPEEFEDLNWGRRLLYRLDRSAWGHGFYYFRIWAGKMVLPLSKDLERARFRHWIDASILIAFGLAVSIWCVSRFGWIAFLCGPAAAFLFWNHIMGFVIYLHHTDPSVKWFEDEKEWQFVEAQLSETIHVRFPRPINLLLHHILEHTAHHLRPTIPLYRLESAQAALEDAFPDHVKVLDWTPSRYLRSIRACKLYDYGQHRWLTFEGESVSDQEAVLLTGGAA